MNNNILLIGSHSLKQSIVKQYEAMGYEVEMAGSLSEAQGNQYHELCILQRNDTPDHENLQALETFAISYPEIPEGQSKPVCHLLLHDKVTLWLLQTLDIYPEIHKKFEAVCLHHGRPMGKKRVLQSRQEQRFLPSTRPRKD